MLYIDLLVTLYDSSRQQFVQHASEAPDVCAQQQRVRTRFSIKCCLVLFVEKDRTAADPSMKSTLAMHVPQRPRDLQCDRCLLSYTPRQSITDPIFQQVPARTTSLSRHRFGFDDGIDPRHIYFS